MEIDHLGKFEILNLLSARLSVNLCQRGIQHTTGSCYLARCTIDESPPASLLVLDFDHLELQLWQ